MAKILHVEDSVAHRRLLQVNLIRQGHEYSAAASVTEALVLLETSQFDLIVLDVDLGYMGGNGLDLLRALRSSPDETFQRMPVLVWTAAVQTDDVARVRLAGATDMAHKPFAYLSDLTNAVGRVARDAATTY